MMKKFDKRQLGRCPDGGRVSFRTGTMQTRTNKLKNRNTRLAKNTLRRQILGD